PAARAGGRHALLGVRPRAARGQRGAPRALRRPGEAGLRGRGLPALAGGAPLTSLAGAPRRRRERAMSTEDTITKASGEESAREERGGVAEAAEKLVSTLFDVGRLWAAHGLGVGRSALQASAETLRATA